MKAEAQESMKSLEGARNQELTKVRVLSSRIPLAQMCDLECLYRMSTYPVTILDDEGGETDIFVMVMLCTH